MAVGHASNDFGSCAGNMGVNWRGSLARELGCRRDVCCIGGGHKGGNECDERGVHNERTVQNQDRLSECCIGFQKGEASGERQKQFSTSVFEGTNCNIRYFWDG